MNNSSETADSLEKITLELRRGALILAVLSQLREEKYGYDLISQLAEKGLEIDQGTLYPLLRRLESQSLLDSTWNVSGNRPRRYYVLNANGEKLLRDLIAEWQALTDVMQSLLS